MRAMLRCLAVSLVVGFSAEALADWQYTKWGMTAEEVIAASGGKARKFTDTGQDTDTERLQAITPYRTGDFAFEAGFMFSRKDGRLRSVRLKLVEGDGLLLSAALVNRYGKPVSESKTAFTQHARWLDKENNNTVVWFVIGADYFTVQYSPLIGESEKGL